MTLLVIFVDVIFVLTNTHFDISEYECGNNFFASTGTITSPNYPGDYTNMRRCYYLIRVPNAQQIKFTITDFETELAKDYFEYGEGYSVNVNQASGQLHGVVTPGSPEAEFIIDGDQAWIYFSTDRNNVARGWTLTYEAGKSK